MKFPDIDPRMAKMPLIGSVTPTSLLVLFYLIFVKVLGPSHMKNRKPYNLKIPIIFYNFALVVYSVWMFYKFGKHGWFNQYRWVCEPITFSVDANSMEMVRVSWHYFNSKFIEFLDTVFFILRKKDGNVSSLHVTHHCIAPFTAWFILGHGATGFTTMLGFINTFVHIWMYLYYALSALGPSMQKYLWWKKYLTKLQMIQLGISPVILLVSYLHPRCEANMILLTVNTCVCILLFALFANFYKTSYRKKQRGQRPTSVMTNHSSNSMQNSSGANGNGIPVGL